MQHADEAAEGALGSPSDAEIEAWTARERQRRQEWLSGPTPEQAAVWASGERRRRRAEREHGGLAPEAPGERAQSTRVKLRDAQFAVVGAGRLLSRASLKGVWQGLVRAGYEWEEEFTPAVRSRKDAGPR